jgi:recombinational DNA repair protein (RecF pathway)
LKLEPATTLGILISLTHRAEGDLLISVLTASGGKLVAYVRAARQSSKRFSGKLDLFDTGLWTFSSKGDSVSFLKSFQRTESFFNLTNSLPSLLIAYALCEISHTLITHPVTNFSNPQQEQPSKTYELIIDCLSRCHRQLSERVLLKSFYQTIYGLLHDQGYGTDILPFHASPHQLTLLLNHCETIMGRKISSKDEILSLAHKAVGNKKNGE